MNFSDKLLELRKSQKLSQKELARRIGVSQASINYWEKGQRVPSINAACKIAEYFKIDTSELLEPDIYNRESTTLLGENVKRLREKKGYSTKKLSELTGITQSTIEKYESNILTPKHNNIVKLASVLDPCGEELLGEKLPFYLYYPGDDTENSSFSYMHVESGDVIRSSELNLINNFRELNEQGQFEANKRVEELTEIVRYLKVKRDNYNSEK